MLQVHNLDVSYGPLQVLFDVNVEVKRGEVLALLGTNGAGKSTLLRAVCGLVLPDRGVVRMNGRTITLTDPELRVAMGMIQVPGGEALFPTQTVAREPQGVELAHRGPAAPGRAHRCRARARSPWSATVSIAAPGRCPAVSSRCSRCRRR